MAATARRAGVAPATLRTWDRRYGIGPSDHTPGRPRRYSSDDLTRLDLMNHVLLRGATPADAAAHALAALPPHLDATRIADADRPAPELTTAGPAATAALVGIVGAGSGGRFPTTSTDRAPTGGAGLRMPGVGRRARGLGRAVLTLDAEDVREVLIDSVAAVGLRSTWDDTVRPVLAAVGQRWADTGAGIEIEHLLSECVTAVFSARPATAPPAVSARPVLLAGMAGDQHRLPLIVLTATLAERGVDCRSLGVDLPQVALVAAIRRTAPAAVLLWSQLRSTADPQVLWSLPRVRPGHRSFVAGPGWTGVELPPLVIRLTSLQEATDVVCRAVC